MTMPAAPHAPFRLFYIDDSGSVDSGWIVYSWIECTVADWRTGLRGWLDLRKELFARYQIPPAFEIHTTKFAGGRDNPSTDAAWNRNKKNRYEPLELALGRIAATPELKVGTVCRQTSAKGGAYSAERGDVYAKLVRHLDSRLGSAGEAGMIFMDGDGTEKSYRKAHRDLTLSTRNIIEDPLFQGSHLNQWVQMADLAAWSAFQGLNRSKNRKFAWAWYDTYLKPSDPNGTPMHL